MSSSNSGTSANNVLNNVNSATSNMPSGGGSTGSGLSGDLWSLVGSNKVVYDNSGTRHVAKASPHITAKDLQALIVQAQNTQGGIDKLKSLVYYSGFGDAPVIGGDSIDKSFINSLSSAAEWANSNGYGLAELQSAMEQRASSAAGAQYGSTADYASSPGGQLRTWLVKNGLNLGDDYVTQQIQNMVEGSTNLDSIKADLRKKYLVNKYVPWADQINQGIDVADIASPYIAAMAQTLGMPETAININDPLIQKALSGSGADGKPSYTPLWQFEQQLRHDPRWMQTDTAQDTVASTALDVLKMFGIEASVNR